MHIKYIEINYVKCHISLNVQNNSWNKINYTDIPLCFLLQQQFLEDIIKANIKVILFITINTLHFDAFSA